MTSPLDGKSPSSPAPAACAASAALSRSASRGRRGRRRNRRSQRPPESFPEHERDAGWRGIASVVGRDQEAGRGQRSALTPGRHQTGCRSAPAFEHVRRNLGRIDILVNNAGLAIVSGKKNLWEMDDDEWCREIDVNLNGVYHCCKAPWPSVSSAGRGRAHHQHLVARRPRRRSRSTAATRRRSSPSSASPRCWR